MATKKITDLATVTSADSADLVQIVDVSDTTMSSNGTNKKITVGNLVTGGGGSGTVTNVATGTGLSGGPITTTGTVALADTAVTAATYNSIGAITVDAQGRLTSATALGGRYVVRSVALSNSDVQNMGYSDTPKTLVAAESGKIFIPYTIFVEATYATSTESSSENLYVGWDAANSGTTEYWGYSRDFMNAISAGTRAVFFGGPHTGGSNNMYDNNLANKNFQIWGGGNFNGGWTGKVYVSGIMMDE